MLNVPVLLSALTLLLGAMIAWAVSRKRAAETESRLRAELETLRSARSSAELALADARGNAETAKAQIEALQTTSAAAVTEASLRAREQARAELETEAKKRFDAALAEAKEQAAQSAGEARRQADAALEQARTKAAEAAQRDERVSRREGVLDQKEASLAQRDLDLARRDKQLAEREAAGAAKETEANRLLETRKAEQASAKAEQLAALEKLAGLTADEARARLVDEMLDSARATAAKEARAIEDGAREEADKRAKRLIGIAIQRLAGEYTSERAVTTVTLPNDDLKGRIIGREGRNIRTFQEITGVDLVIDDTPETIVLSAFDPVKREVARIALEQLIADGRIHPTRIEEFVAKAREEVDRSMRDAAEAAVLELGLARIHPEILKLVGMLRYRYSYAQNVLRHSIEAAFIAGMIAEEMGMSVKQARRAAFLHDIGKAVSHEVEGSHAVIGGQFARKFGEDEEVANAIASHHEDEPPKSTLAHIVAAADAISGARPGARREALESYVRRIEDIERICGSFRGVERSFAISAGREVRVFVEPSEVDDAGAAMMARDIAKRIEGELAYPGQIRVTVVRETRAVDYAR